MENPHEKCPDTVRPMAIYKWHDEKSKGAFNNFAMCETFPIECSKALFNIKKCVDRIGKEISTSRSWTQSFIISSIGFYEDDVWDINDFSFIKSRGNRGEINQSGYKYSRGIAINNVIEQFIR